MATAIKRSLNESLANRPENRNKDTQTKIWNATKTTLLFVVMTLIAIVLLFPYIFMLNKSLMTSDQVIDPTVPFFPDITNIQWGNYATLFTQALNGINSYSYRLIFPALVICLIVLSLNLFGDGLRDAFDPKLNA